MYNHDKTKDIRCIKPNALKKPLTFNKELVLQQLRCGGVLEQLRISRAGYPSRLPYANVMRRSVSCFSLFLTQKN